MERFFTTLAGARQEILARCPTERLKFQSLGWAILITSGIATISMWFALTSAMGINPVLAFLIAIVWGLVIMGIDRWLVTSIPPRGSRRLGIALPRLVLAILLGSLISTPIVLRIFQSEINNEIIQLNNAQQQNFVATQQNDSVSRQIAKLQPQVNQLQNVVDSHGHVPVVPANDARWQSLNKQLAAENTQLQQDLKMENCERYGGPGCPAGKGPMYAQYQQAAQQAQQQISTIQGEMSARVQALKAADDQAAPARLTLAQSQLSVLRPELQKYQQQEDQLRNANYSTLPRNGLLIRLQALNTLSGGNFTVNSARFLVFLFFLVIECLPVTVKLLQRPGVYEQILEEQANSELKEARRAIRGGRRGPDFGAGFASSPGSHDPAREPTRAFAVPSRMAMGTDRWKETVREIWGTSEEAMPPRPATPAVAEPALSRPDGNGGRSRLDRVLRGMHDQRPPTVPEQPATELGYDDDDL